MTVNVHELVTLLQDAREAYYNQDPIMSDSEFDALEDQLRGIDPNHAFFTQVGAKPSSKWQKAPHGIPMGSLNKVQNPSSMTDWTADVLRKDPSLQAQQDRFVITEKLDGISISLKYEGGEFVQAITRGDGAAGEDITRNVRLMQGVVKKARDYTGYVRGEIILKKSDHQKHVPEYKNPRNAASGIAKRESDADPCKHLTVIAYQMISNTVNIPNKVTELKLLKALGFETPNWSVHTTVNGILDSYGSYVDSVRDSLDYEIDGLVVECNSPDTMETLGEHGGRPKGAVAFKFPHAEKTTTLRAVRWQVGGSGRLTPVADFDSVSLAGADVKQASLANYSEIERLGIDVGDQIIVSRRNDVIPKVEKLVGAHKPTRIPPPQVCPSCGGKTVRVGEYIICPHAGTCPAQQVGAVKRWVRKLDIKDLGEAVIEAALTEGLIKNIADLYRVSPVQWGALTMSGRRVGESTGTKIVKNLTDKRKISLGNLVGSLGIDLCGQTVCNMIVDAGYDTLEKMEDATVADLAAIPGMGDAKAEAFVDGFKRRTALIQRLLANGVEIKAKAVGNLTGKSFCFTGIRDKAFETEIQDAGGTIKSSVGKSLTYLVAKDPKSTSGKAQKARDLGVQVLSLEEARALL